MDRLRSLSHGVSSDAYVDRSQGIRGPESIERVNSVCFEEPSGFVGRRCAIRTLKECFVCGADSFFEHGCLSAASSAGDQCAWQSEVIGQ